MYELRLPGGQLDSEDAAILPVLRGAARTLRAGCLERTHNGNESRLEPVGQTSRPIIQPAPEQVLEKLESAALATLEKLNRGVLLLDADGTVQFMNRAAHAMFARQAGMVLRQRRLEFTRGVSQAALVRFLATGSDSGSSSSLVLRIDGTRQRSSYRVLVSPLASNDLGGRCNGYCVFIYEPNGGGKPLPPQVLRELYGLTAAETRLVNALFVGQSFQCAAESLGISLNTAKSSLKRVFAKCDVGTQAELLQLLALGPRTL